MKIGHCYLVAIAPLRSVHWVLHCRVSWILLRSNLKAGGVCTTCITRPWIWIGKAFMAPYPSHTWPLPFELKEDRDDIFHNGPYIMDSWGMYLNHWNLDFDLEVDIPSTIFVWVNLPHFPPYCWSDQSLEAIWNVARKYVDKFDPKEVCLQVPKFVWKSIYRETSIIYLLHPR